MKKIIIWIKKDWIAVTVLCLALLSILLVPPSPSYAAYFNYEVLCLLFCLMLVVAGTSEIGLFKRVAQVLVKKGKGLKMITFVLVMLCFFSAMLITNDVALITFVPLTIAVFCLHGTTKMIYVISLQTLAANLGSMLTPIGNPQNLFLYSHYHIPVLKFISITFPVTAIAFLLLTVLSFLMPESNIQIEFPSKTGIGSKYKLGMYGTLFGICMLTVLKMIPYQAVFLIVLLTVLIFDRKTIGRIDYGLLLTFVGFFILLGNLGSLPVVKEQVGHWITNRELATGVLLSQVISNVPAAMMLAPFTGNYQQLVLGTNLGGLGTLIASLASVISFKLYHASEGSRPFRYLGIFTLLNLGMLGLLLLFVFIT